MRTSQKQDTSINVYSLNRFEFSFDTKDCLTLWQLSLSDQKRSQSLPALNDESAFDSL